MGPLDLIPRWALLAALVGAGAFAGLQTLQLADARSSIVKAERVASELRQEIAIANAEAANKAAALRSKVIGAQNEATKREATLRAAYDAALSESDGLRNDIENIRAQHAGATADARAKYEATVGAVLGDCARRYSEVAKAADGHASDSLKLQSAWPK